MKLTNQQITALATKLYREVNLKINKYNENLNSDKEFEKWEKKNSNYRVLYNNAVNACKAIIVNDELKLFCDYYINSVSKKSTEEIDQIVRTVYRRGLPLKQGIGLDTIKEDIVIETIDSENVDEMLEKITSKYINF